MNCVINDNWLTSNYAFPVKVLTANVDLQFTEVCPVSAGKLHDEVSVRRQTAGTVQDDCSPASNLSRVLTTHGVVPQGRCRHKWWNIGQTDDETVRSRG